MTTDNTVQKRITSFFPKTVDAIEWVCDAYGDVFIRKEGLKSEVIELICSKDPELKQLEAIEQFLNTLECPVFEAFNTKSASGRLPVIVEFFRKIHDAIDELEGFSVCKENNPLTECKNQEPDYDTVGINPDTAVPASPEVSKAIDEALGLEEITIRLDKGTFQRLEAKAKEKGIITKALIRNILTDEVRDVLRVEKFGTIDVCDGVLCMHGFVVDFERSSSRKDIAMVDAVIAYMKVERDKHLLEYPQTDTMTILPDGSVVDAVVDALTIVKQQNDIITLGELLERKKHETRS